MLNRLKKMGPGALVAAAFIGPGTITTSTLAGANFGYTLIWALVFASASTIILQEMSARLGTVSQQGLGTTLIQQFERSWLKWPMVCLLLMALYGGNAAYEAGNIAGAAAGLETFFGGSSHAFLISVLSISTLSAALIIRGHYKVIQNSLIALVLLMTIAFVTTFFLVDANILELLSEGLSFSAPAGSAFTIIALIGTTVVPYNLFLHAAVAKANWRTADDLRNARLDTSISIGLGGLIAILILSTAAAGIYKNALSVNNASDMAMQLEPLFGNAANTLLGLGLFAAGLSSAITAPLATAYAVTEVMRLSSDPSTRHFKFIALSVLACGTLFALSGIKPLKLIVVAQFANGLLLPIIAGFLLFAMNQKQVLGEHTNGLIANILGAIVIIVTMALGIRSVLSASGLI
jgi:NRAMP (natural resistance-associated macrophage protein)-like metal ion transporter